MIGRCTDLSRLQIPMPCQDCSLDLAEVGTGKENGNYYSILGLYLVHTGIMEKKWFLLRRFEILMMA